MIRLVTHLEHLLRVHDCVIVPQLGGFVLQVVPSEYVEEDHIFQPMRKEVVFNAKLKHDDGLLHERYMQTYGVNYKKACRMLEEDIAVIQAELRKGLIVPLGTAGALSLGAEGQIVFKAGSPGTFSVDSYGLTQFKLKTWESLHQDILQSETVRQKQKTPYLPVNRRILRIVTASAAAIGLFFLISTPVRKINKDSYQASFIPVHGSLASITWQDDSSDTLDGESSLKPEEFGAIASGGDEKSEAPAAVHSQPKSAPAVATEKTAAATNALESKNTAADERETYYIVIASVGSRKQADEFIASKVDMKAMPNANAIAVDRFVRVYADKFASRDLANVYLSRLKSNPKYSDAWLFTQKK